MIWEPYSSKYSFRALTAGGFIMIIKNASVFTEDCNFTDKDIYIANGCFSSEAEAQRDGQLFDASGCYAIPGLTDIHFHGCMGHDFSEGTIEALDILASYEAKAGVTNIVPATMTLPKDMLLNICHTAKKYAEGGHAPQKARFQGIHLEGPFLSEKKKGAQDSDFILDPDPELFDLLNEASGNRIRLLSLAPEKPKAMEFIEKKHQQVIISLAHTCADYDTAMLAFEKGASHVTHLYDAMNPFTHRAPGLIGAAADCKDVEVELICDGIHIHPAAVRTTFQLFGDDRIILISDSMQATGLSDGDYTLGGQPVKVKGNLAALADGTIAGSVTDLFGCMKNAVLNMGIPLESAVKCAAVNPAKSIGIYDQYGSISAGKKADVLLLRKADLALFKVIIGGTFP